MAYNFYNQNKHSLYGTSIANLLTIIGVSCVLVGGGLATFFGFKSHNETTTAAAAAITVPVVESKPSEAPIIKEETNEPVVVAEEKPEPVVVTPPTPIEPPALTEQQIQAKAKIAELLVQCQENLEAKRLTSSRTGKTALSCYKEVLALEANNKDALQGLKNIETVYLNLAEKAFKRKKLDKVKGYMASIEKIDPESTILADLKQRVETQQRDRKIARLLPRCKRYLRKKKLTTGKRGTALSCYQQVLELDAENETAVAGLQKIEEFYIDWAKKAVDKKRWSTVKNHIAGIEKVNPQSTALIELKQILADAEAE
jgi:type IV secretory pathway VirB10-like protein